MDTKSEEKEEICKDFKKKYRDKKYEMSEWCELPLTLDSTTIDSGIYMAQVIADDLTRMNAVSWQSWTAVNGDGLLDINADGELITYNRYYAFKHFTSFIKPGMVRIRTIDNSKEDSLLKTVAFKDKGNIVIVIVNATETEENIKLCGMLGNAEIYLTDSTHNFEKIYDGKFEPNITVPAKSIMTVCITL
jgi:O-glycosyl hydrolase